MSSCRLGPKCSGILPIFPLIISNGAQRQKIKISEYNDHDPKKIVGVRYYVLVPIRSLLTARLTLGKIPAAS